MNQNELAPVSDEFLEIKSSFGINTNSDKTFIFVNNTTIAYLVGSNLLICNIENMKQKIFSFKCPGRVEILISSLNRVICVANDQKDSYIFKIDLISNEKKRPNKKIENEIIKTSSISNDWALIACVSKNWNLLIFSLQKLKLLDSLKALASQSESTIENVSFFPSDNKRMLLIGNKLIKIFLFTKKGLKFIYSLNCDFMLLNQSWLNKNECLTHDKFGNLFLIEPKQNFIRTVVLNDKNSSDKKSQASLDELDSNSIESLNAPKYSERIRSITSFHKGFFICFHNDDRLIFYENKNNLFKYTQICIIKLKKIYKQVDNFLKETIINVQVNDSGTYLVVLTNRKIVYLLDLSDLFLKKEIILEPVLDGFYSDAISGVDYCVRKSIMAICTFDRWLILWNYDTSAIELRQNFDEDLFTVAFHPSGLYLILATTKSLKYMSIHLDKCKTIQVFNVYSCKNCIFSHGGHLFALIHGTIIQVYSSINFSEIGSIKSQDMGKIKQIRFSKDDHYLLCCSMAGIIRIWNSQTLILINEITTKGLSYIGLDMHPNQEWIFLISTEKSIRQFELLVSEEHKNLIKPNSEARLTNKIPTKPDENLTCIEISKSGKMLCVGTNKGMIRVYSLIDDTYKEYKAHFGSVTNICISYGDECLLTSSDDGSIIFWNINNKLKDVFTEINQSNEETLIDKNEYFKKSKIIENYENKLKESRMQTNFKLRMKELKFNIKKRELKNRFNNQMMEIIDKIKELDQEEISNMTKYDLEYKNLVEEYLFKFEQTRVMYENKLNIEDLKNAELKNKIESLKLDIEANETKLNQLRQQTQVTEYENIEKILGNIRKKGALENLKYEEKIEELINFEYDFEDEIESEILNEKNKFEIELYKLISDASSIKKSLFDIRYEFKSVKYMIISFIKSDSYKAEGELIEIKNQNQNFEYIEIDLESEINLKEENLRSLELETGKLVLMIENLEIENSDLKNKLENFMINYLEPLEKQNIQMNIELVGIKKEIKQKSLDLNRLKSLSIQIKNREQN